MRKLTLELETLEVETFETAESLDGDGTVEGHATGFLGSCRATGCVGFTCPECAYPDETIGDPTCVTCVETCPETCA
jgi:hypothetical protein